MTDPDKSGANPTPVIVSRNFAASRALVFKAWSSAEHMTRWFSPSTYTVSGAEVDFRPGGACSICMRSPAGQETWSRGTFLEIEPPQRLVVLFAVGDAGAPAFTAHTTVTFEEEGAGTRMTVRQVYDIRDEAFRAAVAGAPEGWRTTLDKLTQEVARLQAALVRNVIHAIFTLERRYDAAPATVFHALTDSAAKARWFVGGEGYSVLERHMDVRTGGREVLRGRWASGTVSTYEATYHDVVPDERLVYAYHMHLDERKISVSLATVELRPDGAGTRLTITEQGAFLDGYDDAGAREKGTGMLLDRLGASLA